MNTLEIIILTIASGLIGGFISFYFGQKIEDHRFLLSKKEKIANVASFFAKWVKYRGHEEKWLDKEALVDYYEELTKMSFELALWVDDEKFLKDIMKRLRNEDNSTDTVELLLKAKKLISGKNNKDLNKNDITLWPKDISFLEDGRD